MRKLILFVAVICSLCMVSCAGRGAASPVGSVDSTAVDTTVVDSVKVQANV